MLYVCLLYSLALSGAAVLVYRCGIRDGMRREKGKELEDVLPRKRSGGQCTETEQRLRRGLSNILNYQNRRGGTDA